METTRASRSHLGSIENKCSNTNDISVLDDWSQWDCVCGWKLRKVCYENWSRFYSSLPLLFWTWHIIQMYEWDLSIARSSWFRWVYLRCLYWSTQEGVCVCGGQWSSRKVPQSLVQMCMVRLLRLLNLDKITHCQRSFAEYACLRTTPRLTLTNLRLDDGFSSENRWVSVEANNCRQPYLKFQSFQGARGVSTQTQLPITKVSPMHHSHDEPTTKPVNFKHMHLSHVSTTLFFSL